MRVKIIKYSKFSYFCGSVNCLLSLVGVDAKHKTLLRYGDHHSGQSCVLYKLIHDGQYKTLSSSLLT